MFESPNAHQEATLPLGFLRSRKPDNSAQVTLWTRIGRDLRIEPLRRRLVGTLVEVARKRRGPRGAASNDGNPTRVALTRSAAVAEVEERDLAVYDAITEVA
ncbi:MAG: hypothetical protein H0T94_10400 [Acidimicrobiia bacterium]|nr:hypothetical protein [Acidimicrobiia bacterium]MDQ3501835.1 hypothetical protein [Actinomycetota bacterium]